MDAIVPSRQPPMVTHITVICSPLSSLEEVMYRLTRKLCCCNKNKHGRDGDTASRVDLIIGMWNQVCLLPLLFHF